MTVYVDTDGVLRSINSSQQTLEHLDVLERQDGVGDGEFPLLLGQVVCDVTTGCDVMSAVLGHRVVHGLGHLVARRGKDKVY